MGSTGIICGGWKEWNDEAPDRDLVTLRLYREIVTKTLEYAGISARRRCAAARNGGFAE